MTKNFEDVKRLIEYSKDGITSKVISKKSKTDVTLFCMAAGAELSEHTSTREGIVYVVEGSGTFNLKGEKIKMRPGVIIFMDKNAVHSLAAEKDTAFILILAN